MAEKSDLVARTLEHYRTMADFLGSSLGNGFEIVLQDLTDGNFHIDHIAGDARVTARSEGAPLTDLGMRIVRSGIWKTRDYLFGYVGKTSDGRRLYSSTYFIKVEGELVGMLCINEDRSSYQRISEELRALRGPDALDLFEQDGRADAPLQSQERFYQSHDELVDDAIHRVCPTCPDGPFSPEQRQKIVSLLDRSGAFMVRGMVRTVALRLGCSEPSIYRYRQNGRA